MPPPIPPSLLLLPRGPVSTATYHVALVEAIRVLRTPDTHSFLIVALPLPLCSSEGGEVGEDSSWAAAQSTLARFYALLAAVCAEIGMPSESDADLDCVDVVAVLVSHEHKDDDGNVDDEDAVFKGLGWLARRRGGWKEVFWVDGDEGRRARERFEAFEPALVGGYLEASENTDGPGKGMFDDDKRGKDRRPCGTHSNVCLGGAFDHLHPGHKLLLSAAALLVKRTRTRTRKNDPTTPNGSLIIGISADSLLAKKSYPDQVLPWAVRADAIASFLSSFLSLDPPPAPSSYSSSSSSSSSETSLVISKGGVDVACVEITDAFGPTVTDEGIEALVVSKETMAGGRAVNERRGQGGWGGLEMFVVDVLDAGGVVGEEGREGWQGKISSTEIRRRRAGR